MNRDTSSEEKPLAPWLDFCSFSTLVQLEQKKSASRHVTKSAIAGFLAVLLLGFSALAASPSLHELVHHDAGSADHNCFITFFAKGHFVTSETVRDLTLVAALFGGVALLTETFLLPASDYSFSASRAPPVRF